MKTLLLILTMAISYGLYSQETPDAKKYNYDNLKFECDTIRTAGGGYLVTLSGDVSLKVSLLDIEKADKITLDKKKNVIYAEGVERFSFNGKLVFSGKATNRTITYRISEDKAYLE